MEYTVVYGITLSELITKVNLKLQEGYNVQGGICVAVDRADFRYYQAMTKNP